MMLRRSLLAAAVPAALALFTAGPALAEAPAVYFRVEGATHTVVPEGLVRAPVHGWVLKGGAPKGACPADSAAGALSVATKGRWSGTYDKGLGIEVTSILGTTALYAKGSYWAFYVDKHLATKGLCSTKVAPNESLLLAQVPAKGKAPLPLVLKTKKKAVVGAPVEAFTYVFPGQSDRTAPVTKVHFTVTEDGKPAHATIEQTTSGGITGIIATRPGTLRIFATAPGYIRSAARTVTVAG